MREHLFVINAIINSVKRGPEDPVDIGVFDVNKCFDSLWVEDCINDMFEAGLRNDKLPLLYIMNQNANIAIKNSWGLTERTNIRNIIMQGTTWGIIFCTTSMDKLGQKIYQNEKLLYKYKGCVNVPPLEMVDDIASVSKCDTTSSAVNEEINSFIEHKKLTFGLSKCAKIHIGKKCDECPQYVVHNNVIKESQKEKYLGDYINNKGSIKDTILDRQKKGMLLCHKY